MGRSEEWGTGNKFLPSDDELVAYYLYHKICGIELSNVEKNYVIEYDLYGQEEPSSIWKRFDGADHQDLFVITKLKRSMKKNGEVNTRFIRKVGVNGGTWHGESVPQPFPVFVKGLNRKVVATRRNFNYRNPGSEEHFLWRMTELSVKEFNDDYVICRLRKNSRGAKVVDCEKKRKVNAEITGNNIMFAKKQKRGDESENSDELPGLSEFMMKYRFDPDEVWVDSYATIASESEMNNDDSHCIVAYEGSPECHVSGTEIQCADDTGIEDAVDEITFPYTDWLIPELVSSHQEQQSHVEVLPSGPYVKDNSISHPISFNTTQCV